MSGTSTAIVSGSQLPSAVRDVLRQYGEARMAGQPERAISVLEDALSGIRAAPYGTPFMARVQLALTLAVAYLDAGIREHARRLLLDESVYCDMIVQALALN